MSKYVSMDFSHMSKLFDRMGQAANGGFKHDMQLFLEGLGYEFLRVLQDEIMRRGVVDTRLLLHSFSKGEKDSVWEINEGGLTLEIGTKLEYAGYVNDGHWMVDENSEKVMRYKKDTKDGKHKAGELKLFNGKIARFVHGDVEEDANGKIIKFTYRKDAKTGIMLKQKWVEGTHYWESALKILDKIYPSFLDAKLQEWIDKYFEI